MKQKIAKLLVTSLTLGIVVVGGNGTVSAKETPDMNYIMASDICQGSDGTLLMTDAERSTLWKYKITDGSSTLLSGKEEVSGYKNGSLKNARFSGAWGIEEYKGGYVVSDTENHVLRMIKNKKVTTFAGTGKAGKKNGTLKKATFKRPTGLAVGDKGELYVADTGNSRICVIDKLGNVKAYVGGKKGCTDGKLKSAKLNEPTGLYYNKGVLYIADSGNHRVCKVESGKLTTIAGSTKGIEGSKNGRAKDSRLSYPQGITVAKGIVYIADTGNGCIRTVKNGKVETLVEAYSQQEGLLPAAPRGLYVKGSYLYFGDLYAGQVVKVKR